jgi:hypothetical protein
MLKFILSLKKGGWGCTLTKALDSYGSMHCPLDIWPVENIQMPVAPKIMGKP